MSTVPLPIGFPLGMKPDEHGELSFPTLEQSVRQTIKAILATKPGERLMRPDFGAGLESFVHQPNTIAVRRQIRDNVADALARWETRIAVDRIDVTQAPDKPSVVRVEIAYRLRRTGAPQALGVTLELGG